MTIKNIIFDLGGVLIDWNPEYLYKKVFKEEAEMHFFLQEVCTLEWNQWQDAGRTFQEANELLLRKYPQYKTEIEFYFTRWVEMLGGEISESVELLKKLQQTKRFKTLALTNWSHETFPKALEIFPFLSTFDGTLVSGEDKLIKPNPEIFKLLFNRFDITAEESLFIDDNILNIQAAQKLKIKTIHFTNSQSLEAELIKLSLI